MKRSSSFLALAVGLVLAASAAVVTAVKETAATVYRITEAAFVAVLVGPPMHSGDSEVKAQLQPRVTLNRAGRFVERLLKRERPQVTPDWRMVPST